MAAKIKKGAIASKSTTANTDTAQGPWRPPHSAPLHPFSSYDGDLSLPLGLALGSPIFPSGCEGKLGVASRRPHATAKQQQQH